MIATPRQFTHEEVIAKLRELCDTFATRAEAADSLGVSRVFLWRVLEGNVLPTDTILKHIGFKRKRKVTYTYEKV